MKAMILSAALVLVSSAAFAYPAVNDVALLNGTYVTNGVSYPLEIANSITQFNAATHKFLQTQVTSIGGQKDSSTDWMDESEFLSQAAAQDLVTNCVQNGGTPETLSVTAGTFATCKLEQADSESTSVYWIGDVPFGIVQAMQSGEGYELNATLTSFVVGQ